MLKRLSEKKLILYKPYSGVKLTELGKRSAIRVIRKQRLWEVFLVEKLKFKWDEVHDIAEQLEHIDSDALVEKLDVFLKRPKTDPHGDPIPDTNGHFSGLKTIPLAEAKMNRAYCVSGVSDHSPVFLRQLTQFQIDIGRSIRVISRNTYDYSLQVKVKGKDVFFSYKIARHILVQQV
jgi:DtxR family Mn-dependent transcriptional regulator